MTHIRIQAEIDLQDIDTSDLIEELVERDEWDEVCSSIPTSTLVSHLQDRDDLIAIYELLRQGKEAAALDRVREVSRNAAGRVL